MSSIRSSRHSLNNASNPLKSPEQLKVSGRKRPLEHSEDDIEYIPISKKLNRLHIDHNSHPLLNNNNHDAITGHSVNSNHSTASTSSTAHHPTGHNNNNHSNSVSQHIQALMARHHPSYLPSLSSDENPLYYEANRLLYEAHMYRLERISQQQQRRPLE